MSRATTGAATTSPVLGSARWLAIPVFIGLFGLIALGVSAEDNSTYRENRIGVADPGLDELDGQPLDQASDTEGEAEGDGGIDPLDADQADRDGDDDEGLNDGEQDDGDAGRIIMVAGDDGSISITLGDGQSTATPSRQTTPPTEAADEGSGGSGSEGRDSTGSNGRDVILRPDSDGPADGVRLEDDGQLVPLEGDEIEAGDLAVRPTESGVEVLGPDGAGLIIEPSGFDGLETDLSFIDRGADGSTAEVFPDENGRIELGDGVSVLVEPGPNAGLNDPESESSTPWLVIVAAFALLLALGATAFVLTRRRKPTEPFGVDFVGPEGIPTDRFEEFIAMLSADPIPGRAVRLAFLAAERGMPDLPARNPMETSFEWVRRVTGRRPDLREPMYSLARHFAAARFTNDETSPAARDAALEDLRRIERLARMPAPDQKVPVTTS